ncbi:MAG: imidazole glycerol phosphate synthase subunit HisH [Gemmatimonadota bacterium]
MTDSSTGPHLALFDYGAGNLHSLQKGLEAGGARVTVTQDWNEALARDGLVLPGVGSFGAAVRAMAGWEERVRKALADGLPGLGICLGMQLLFPESEEGAGTGIGLIPGRVLRFEGGAVPRIPQMGWNDVEPLGGSDPVVGPATGFSAYYANSYICRPDDSSCLVAQTTYGHGTFPAAVRTARTWGVQFHPEKSSAAGVELLGRFVQEVAR